MTAQICIKMERKKQKNYIFHKNDEKKLMKKNWLLAHTCMSSAIKFKSALSLYVDFYPNIFCKFCLVISLFSEDIQ